MALYRIGNTVLLAAIAALSLGCDSVSTRFVTALSAEERAKAAELPAYIIAQVLGAIVAAYTLFFIASGTESYDLAVNGLAANGYGEHSPGKYSMMAGLTSEVVMTAMFLFIILGVTDSRAAPGFAGVAIGLALTLIHLISIPVTNTAVNPARSTGPALVVGDWAIGQLWLFWVAPIVGAIIAGLVHRYFEKESTN